jgi:hypothetical protein
VLDGRVLDVTRLDDDRFESTSPAATPSLPAVLAATGLVDRLPDIDGVARH